MRNSQPRKNTTASDPQSWRHYCVRGLKGSHLHVPLSGVLRNTARTNDIPAERNCVHLGKSSMRQLPLSSMRGWTWDDGTTHRSISMRRLRDL
eukprot:scaffold654573_cov43-Prasinocladus_malaysianus.AAC.1